MKTRTKRTAAPARPVSSTLISNPVNILYLTGFAGASATEHEAYLFVSQGTRHLLTNSLYIERARELAATRGNLEVVQISRSRTFDRAILELVKKTRTGTIFYEGNHLTVNEFASLRHVLPDDVLLKRGTAETEKLRMIKTQPEIRAIRKAAAATDRCFTEIIKYVKPGKTEKELAFRLDFMMKKIGADAAFAPIVAFGEHASQPHYIPRQFALEHNTPVLLDFGAKVDGYCADMTRVVSLDVPKAEVVRAHGIVLKAHDKAISYLNTRRGTSGAQADRRTKLYIQNHRLPPYSHSLGHSVGLEIHEAPRLTVKKDAKLSPGMVFSVEPATYVPGRFGIRIEDLVLRTETGIRILSESPRDLIIL